MGNGMMRITRSAATGMALVNPFTARRRTLSSGNALPETLESYDSHVGRIDQVTFFGGHEAFLHEWQPWPKVPIQ
jgi:hypothetical protein